MLQEWSDISQKARTFGNIKVAKEMLKKELEKLKPNILAKVESAKMTDYGNIGR